MAAESIGGLIRNLSREMVFPEDCATAGKVSEVVVAGTILSSQVPRIMEGDLGVAAYTAFLMGATRLYRVLCTTNEIV